MTNRYNELTPEEQVAIDRLINHLASLPIDPHRFVGLQDWVTT